MLVNSLDVGVVGISTFDMVLFIHDNYDAGCSAPTISLSWMNNSMSTFTCH